MHLSIMVEQVPISVFFILLHKLTDVRFNYQFTCSLTSTGDVGGKAVSVLVISRVHLFVSSAFDSKSIKVVINSIVTLVHLLIRSVRGGEGDRNEVTMEAKLSVFWSLV